MQCMYITHYHSLSINDTGNTFETDITDVNTTQKIPDSHRIRAHVNKNSQEQAVPYVDEYYETSTMKSPPHRPFYPAVVPLLRLHILPHGFSTS